MPPVRKRGRPPKGKGFRMELRGHVGMARALKRLRTQTLNQLKKQLPGAAAGLMLGANAPVQDGTLESSAFVAKPFARRGFVGIRAGYTDPKAPAVHEGFHGGKKRETARRNWFSDAKYRYAAPFKRWFGGQMEQAFRKALAARRGAR